MHDAIEAATGSSSSTAASYASSSTFTDTPLVRDEAEESDSESSLATPLSQDPITVESSIKVGTYLSLHLVRKERNMRIVAYVLGIFLLLMGGRTMPYATVNLLGIQKSTVNISLIQHILGSLLRYYQLS